MIGAKLKIALLYDLWNEDPVAAAAKEEKEEAEAPSRKPRKKAKKVKKKEKTDREEIFEALQKLGHEPSYFELDGRPQSLHSLSRCDADLIFNLTESFDGDDTREMNVVAYIDLLGLRYTGVGPHGIILSQDKAIAKKIFGFHGIKTPFFATAYRGRIEHAHDISFPLIVKPSWEDGSIGIDAGSVVKSVKEMMERIEYIQDEFDSPAIIEEYLLSHGDFEFDEIEIVNLRPMNTWLHAKSRKYIDLDASPEEQEGQIAEAEAEVEVSGEYDGNDGP